VATEFRLNSLLDYRQRVLDQLQLDLAALVIRHREERERLEGLRQLAWVALQEIDPLGEQTDVAEMARLAEYLTFVNKQVSAQKSLMLDIGRDVDEMRQRVTEATKDSRVVEKLQERHVAQELQESRRLDQKEMEEVATQQRRMAQIAQQ